MKNREIARIGLYAAQDEVAKGKTNPSKMVRGAASHWSSEHWIVYASFIKRAFEGFAYVINADYKYFKIGKSKNPAKRTAEMSTGNPHELELEIALPGGFYSEVLLRSIAENLGFPKAYGEWFEGDGVDFLEVTQCDDAPFAHDAECLKHMKRMVKA